MNKEGKIILFVLLFLTILITPFGKSYENESYTVNVSVNITQPYIEVEITPDAVSLGEITFGYNSNSSNITFKNKGTLGAKITPILETGANSIFNYLEFGTSSCSTWKNITYYGSSTLLTVDKPSTYKGTEKEKSACVRLGLDSYNGTEVESDITLSTKLIFWVMPV